ncbi:hypothetical protein BX616_006955, partial [Lobosporangium transversale]
MSDLPPSSPVHSPWSDPRLPRSSEGHELSFGSESEETSSNPWEEPRSDSPGTFGWSSDNAGDELWHKWSSETVE